jgi:CHASE2 domain-containing sensor protein
LLGRARSIGDVIAVQNQLQQVQSNIERLQGQVNHLEDQSSFSTIVLNLSEPGAGGTAQPRSRLERAWATAVSGLAVMGAAALVGLVWLTPVAALAFLVLLVLRAVRRPRPA